LPFTLPLAFDTTPTISYSRAESVDVEIEPPAEDARVTEEYVAIASFTTATRRRR
jgi:hypothetical protein